MTNLETLNLSGAKLHPEGGALVIQGLMHREHEMTNEVSSSVERMSFASQLGCTGPWHQTLLAHKLQSIGQSEHEMTNEVRPSVERTWHIYNIQGLDLAFAFRQSS